MGKDIMDVLKEKYDAIEVDSKMFDTKRVIERAEAERNKNIFYRLFKKKRKS